jgi:hypothetical protein
MNRRDFLRAGIEKLPVLAVPVVIFTPVYRTV